MSERGPDVDRRAPTRRAAAVNEQTTIPAVPPQPGGPRESLRPPLPPEPEPPPSLVGASSFATDPPPGSEAEALPVSRPPRRAAVPFPVGVLAAHDPLPTLAPRPEPRLWFDPRTQEFLPAPPEVDLFMGTRWDLLLAALRLGLLLGAGIGVIASLRAEDPWPRLALAAAAAILRWVLGIGFGPVVCACRIDRAARTVTSRLGCVPTRGPVPFDRIRSVSLRARVVPGTRYAPPAFVHQLGADLEDGDWIPVSDQLQLERPAPPEAFADQVEALRVLFGLDRGPARPRLEIRDDPGSGPMQMMRGD